MRLVYSKPTASGRRTGWARTIMGLDADQRGAKAFRGDYLRDGDQVELADGLLVLEVRPEGSVKNGWQQAHVLRVAGDKFVELADFNWREQYLDLLDFVREQLRARTTEVE